MLSRLTSLCALVVIRVLWLVGGSRKWHMPFMLWWLKRKGVRMSGRPIYISGIAWIDSSDYSKVALGDKVVISSGVRILTHDYAIARALEAANIATDSEVAFVRPVTIGDNSFVGTYAIVMPGTEIGRNVIVSAGTVVKGKVADNMIIAGNPWRVVGNTLEYATARKRYLSEPSARYDR